MIDVVYRNCGQKEMVDFFLCTGSLMLGFRGAFKAGTAFGKDDMVVLHFKPQHFISETSALARV